MLRICLKMNRVLQRDDTGFTLMELLLAITLFSIIAVAIYSALAVGIKVHKRGSSIGGDYNDLALAFSVAARDLRTAIHINNIYLVEESQMLYFFSVQPAQDGTRELYKITYTWEKEKDYYALLRLRETFIDSQQTVHPKGDELLDGISRIVFDYGYLKKGRRGDEELQWKGDWKEEAMPKLVRFQTEKEGEKFNKLIYCPAGKMGEVKE